MTDDTAGSAETVGCGSTLIWQGVPL